MLNGYRQGELLDDEAIKSGFIAPGEKMIVIGQKAVPKNISSHPLKEPESTADMIFYLRIAWLLVSVGIIGFLVLRYRRQEQMTDDGPIFR